MTPKEAALAKIRPNPTRREVSTAPAAPESAGVEMILVEERDGAVYFARVRDLDKLMASRELHLHKDVLDTLADLVLALVGEEGSDVSGSRG